MTLEELEARISRLEDIEAIKKLTASFGYLIDAKDWKAVANLFVENAIADFGPFEQYQGKADIHRFYRDVLPPQLSVTVHMLHNPIIEVKGGNARGEWNYEVSATQAPTNEAMWIAGKFENEYVKVNGEWKLKKCVARPYYITSFEEGWAKANYADTPYHEGWVKK